MLAVYGEVLAEGPPARSADPRDAAVLDARTAEWDARLAATPPDALGFAAPDPSDEAGP